MSTDWQQLIVAPCRTHHLLHGRPAYEARYLEVMKFHSPGLAPARDESGAFHITPAGEPAYPERHFFAFGFYDGRAAVRDVEGWFHVDAGGTALYAARYAWCGNFQEGLCPVLQPDTRYLHICLDGSPAYPSRYCYAGDFRDGVAVVQRDDGLHSHIERSGRLLHGRWFRDLDVFHKGFARACDESGWHHVDRAGCPAYRRRFNAVEPFYNGQARVEADDGSLLVIDEAGETLLTLRPPASGQMEKLSADMVGFWRTQTIMAAVELGLFEALPETAAGLDGRLGLAPGMGGRLLRALCELGLVRKEQGTCLPTERGALLAANHDLSMAVPALLWGREHYLAWTGLAGTLRSGQASFEAQHGRPFFEWLAGRPAALQNYHDAISAYARHDYAALGRALNLSHHDTVLDAGGGRGELLFALLRSNANLKGVLLDRPEVLAGAIIPEELASRCTVACGDLFEPWPVSANAIVLARVLHDWPDEQAETILKQARSALAAGGRLYVVELVLDDHTGRGGMLDLNMAIMTGGRERTELEFQALLRSAGLRLLERRDLPSVSSILIAEHLR